MSFMDQLNTAIKNIETKKDDDIKRITVDLYNSIIMKTPVDTGELRRSWVMSKDSKGYVIATSVIYAPAIEYGLYPKSPKGGQGKTVGGFSTQAPQGMVRISIKEIANKWK